MDQAQTKNKLWHLVKEPYRIVGEKKSEFAIWVLFTIVSGQIGILFNIVARSYSNNTPITHSILIDSINGNFYTYAIALSASILGPLFINFINSKELKFKTLKIFTIIITIFFLMFSGVIYSAVQSNYHSTFDIVKTQIDWTQFIVYIIAIVIVSYGYCILRLEKSDIDFDSLDDPLFNELDDEKVEETVEEAESITEDQNGNKL
jgi:hypothetical protein